MLSFATGTVICIEDTQLAHSENYVVLGERHVLRDGLNVHDATYDLMPLGRLSVLLVDIAGRSELDENVAGY
jgi:hypothetical protein